VASEFSDSEKTEAVKKGFGVFARRRASVETPGAVDDPALAEMRKNRRVNSSLAKREAAAGGGNGASTQFATGRPRDPFFYWKQNNLPYNTGEHTELVRVRLFCRFLYQSHPVIASCIDIFTKYPLLGMELECKDEKIKQFYEDLFFTEEGLNYHEFLIDFGREYWTVGEAWPLGTFNDILGIWEDEELLNPDDVEVQRSPFLKEPRFLIKLPQTIRELVQRRTPAWEYEKLVRNYPELINFSQENDMMPVSSVLLRQYKFKGDTFNPRGIPILMRAMRSVVQEEMLNSAMDAIADRLYTPLILVRLGASATDIGTTQPWIPTDDDLSDFEEALDAALAADFRAIVYHFGVKMESVFGRENMPDLNPDFERIEDRLLQTFGLSRTMLSGASSGETYAADALNRDLVSQLLTTFQTLVKRHFRQRALVVAEAQEHFDYEERDGKRYPIMEEILEVDEETGEERIVEQPKLLVPELRFKSMNLSDEESKREFLEALRAAGVPISIRTRIANSDLDLEEEMERTQQEAVQLAVAEQETRKEIYLALFAQGLPIPADLAADFTPTAAQASEMQAPPGRVPMLGLDPVTDPANLAPTGQDLAVPAPGAVMPGLPTQPVDPASTSPIPAQADNGDEQAQRPEESDEQRANMPKKSELFKNAARMREVAKAHPDPVITVPDDAPEGATLSDYDPLAGSIHRTPAHIGKRRYLKIDKNEPLDDTEEN
jgi:hypothetical protein